MDAKILLIGLVVGLIVGVGAGYGSVSPQLSSLQSKVSTLQGQADLVPGLQQQLAIALTNSTSFQSQVLPLHGQVTSLQVQVTTLQGQLSTKNSEAANLQTTINDKTSQVTALQGQVTDLQSQVTSLQAQVSASSKPAPQSNVTVLAVSFSRVDDTSTLLQYWIGRANSTIRVAVMDFTYDALGDAIIAAKNRGINVEVYIDNGYVSGTGSEYPRLLSSGVQIRADTPSALMHHKFIVIDGVIVGTGSYNWSAAAENSNDENLIILRSHVVAQDYLTEFNRLWGSS